MTRAYLYTLLEQLEFKQRLTWIAHALGYSFKEIAKFLKVTTSRVYQIFATAERSLRRLTRTSYSEWPSDGRPPRTTKRPEQPLPLPPAPHSVAREKTTVGDDHQQYLAVPIWCDIHQSFHTVLVR